MDKNTLMYNNVLTQKTPQNGVSDKAVEMIGKLTDVFISDFSPSEFIEIVNAVRSNLRDYWEKKMAVQKQEMQLTEEAAAPLFQ